MDLKGANGCLEEQTTTESPVKIVVTEPPPDHDDSLDINSSYYSVEGATAKDQSYDTEFSENDVIRDVSREEERFADARETFSLDLSEIKDGHSNGKVTQHTFTVIKYR